MTLYKYLKKAYQDGWQITGVEMRKDKLFKEAALMYVPQVDLKPKEIIFTNSQMTIYDLKLSIPNVKDFDVYHAVIYKDDDETIEERLVKIKQDDIEIIIYLTYLKEG